MGGMVDKTVVRLVRSDERRCTRKPPINMGAPAPKIWDIPCKVVVPDGVGDEIHVDTCANLAGRDFSSMEALDFPAISKDEWVLRQHNVGMAPDKTCSNTAPPGMPKDVGELHHFRSRVKHGRLQSQHKHAFEKSLLSDAKAFVWARVDPLKGDPQIHLRPRINLTIRRFRRLPQMDKQTNSIVEALVPRACG